MTRLLVVLVLTLIFGHGAPAADQPRQSQALRAEDFVVAGVVEGMRANDVRRVLGRPQTIDTQDDFRDPGNKLISWRYKGIVVLLGSENTVRGDWITSQKLATSRGLRVGDPVARIESLYGTPTFRDNAI